MRAKTVQDRENAFLAAMLDRLSAQFAGKVRKRKVIEALGRFSYVAALYNRIALAAAAEEARAFVEGSAAAGKVLVSLVAELRKEVGSDASATAAERIDIRQRVSAVMKAADPRFLRFGPPRMRVLSRRVRRADFRGRADSSALTSLSVKLRGSDPTTAAAFLMSFEEQGLVAVGGDPYRKTGTMLVVSGTEAVRRIRSSKLFSSKPRKHLRALKRRAPLDPAALDRSARAGLRYPVGLTLLGTALVALSLSCMAFLTVFTLMADTRGLLEESVRMEAGKVGRVVEEAFRGFVAKARFLQSLGSAGSPPDDFFAANPEIIYAGVEGKSKFLNTAKLDEWKIPAATVDLILSAERGLLEAGKEVPVVGNISPYLGRPAALLVAPYQEAGEWHSLAIAVDTTSLIDCLRSSGSAYSIVVNADGHLILHPELVDLVVSGQPKALPIVASLLHGGTGEGRAGQTAEYAHSFSSIAFADLYAVALAPLEGAYRSVDRIRRLDLIVLGATLGVALLFMAVYAASVRRRILQLMVASQRFGLLPPTAMPSAAGQDGRKATLRDGERRVAAVLRSEIRGFTTLAEHLEPSETVDLLNGYLAAMSGCAEKTGGIVQRSGDDAVSAVWGVPVTTGRDAAAAVDGALLMRAALEAMNKARGTARRPLLRIGCAIHFGPVLAGRMEVERGSEYVLMGETAKLASHLVSLTRRFAVDILVSEAVRVELEATYRLAVLPRVIVSGKSRPQHVYAVLGRYDQSDAPRSIAELRERLGIPGILST